MKEKIIVKWSNNPQELVNKINSNIGKVFHLTNDKDSKFYRVPIYKAELKYNKFIHIYLTRMESIPIFEGIDKIKFLE